jgi:adenylosuccinate synthase
MEKVMKSLAVLGVQWGDEGKGKIVHLLSDKADIICRYQGGNNAGHTVVTGGRKYVLHLIPSGILNEDKICIIGNGVVVNPYALRDEMNTLKEAGVSCVSRLFVSDRATLIMPYHIELDNAYEESLGIGTTRRGIGPAYSYKYARLGIRPCDLEEPEYMERVVGFALEEVNATLAGRFGRKPVKKSDVMDTVKEYRGILKPFIADTSMMLRKGMAEDKRVIFEGAQGVLLDVDFGSYPYVTSSNPSAGGILTGLGIGPSMVNEIVGVTKAYTTRVGGGPFPTELDDDTGEYIRKKGGEFGASTGRPRRCGWFDAVCTRYAIEVSGVDRLAMTKFDVLDGLDTINVCTHYSVDGEKISEFPANAERLGRAVPLYREFRGWERIAGIRDYGQLPETAVEYIDELEKLLGVPISIVSTGPEERNTILREAF